MFELAPWLTPIEGENPSGANLRDDPAFHDLERLATPQIEVVRDERNNPSSQIVVPVDWPAVLAQAEQLAKRGRDLRLLVLVVRGLSSEHGLAGLAEGLRLIARTFDQYWDSMHPALRVGAPSAEVALRRLNALLELQNGDDGLLFELRQKVFLTPRGIGPIGGRDLERGSLDERTMLNEAASGLNDAEKAALVQAHEQLIARVRKGCIAQSDQSPDDMASLTEDARAALAALDEVDESLAAKLDAPRHAAPALRQFLERVLATIERAATTTAQGGAAADQAAAEQEAAEQEADAAADSPPGKPNGSKQPKIEGRPMVNNAALPDRLTSREEVVKCLDLVVEFYDSVEPSSPIPHLARRIRRMVPMDFVELMEDLAPTGLKEFRALAGMPDGKKMAQKDER